MQQQRIARARRLILLRKFSLFPSSFPLQILDPERASERDADDVVDSDGCLRHIVSKEGMEGESEEGGGLSLFLFVGVLK